MSKIIKIGIAEDHDILRQTMSRLLQSESNLHVSIQAANGQELLDLMTETPVDVVILDLNMPVLDGKSTLKSISRMNPSIRPSVIILSMYNSDEHVRKYIGLGANAYLSKGSEYPVLLKAIKEVYHNGYYFNEQVTRNLISEVIRQTSKPGNNMIDTPLSEREIEIVQLICHQKTNPEMADVLGISQRTVENHRLRIMKKIGAKTSVGLLIYAMRNGLTDIESL